MERFGSGRAATGKIGGKRRQKATLAGPPPNWPNLQNRPVAQIEFDLSRRKHGMGGGTKAVQCFFDIAATLAKINNANSSPATRNSSPNEMAEIMIYVAKSRLAGSRSCARVTP
jgi:hypothetical protein